MPRNGQGIYSLPEPAFIPGTVISSAAVNEDFSDIATALTDSVAADGQTPVTGQLLSSVVAEPAYSSSVDPTTGFGVSAADTAAVWVGGNKVINVGVTTTSVSNTLTVGGDATVSGAGSYGGTLTVQGPIIADGGLVLSDSTGAFALPDGDTAQRPGTATIAQAQVRYNNSYGNFEGYDGTEWQNLSSQQTGIAISTSVAGGLLTVSLLNAKTGAAPTVADPIAVTFGNANGTQSQVVASYPVTINTNGVGADLGATISNAPFRFWVVGFDNAGSLVPALVNCLQANGSIFSVDETSVQSATGISSGATSAATYYCTNGVTVTNQAVKILGYIEYASGVIATPGTYASTPSVARIYSSGMKRPGDSVRRTASTITTPATVTSTFATVQSTTPTLTSAANVVCVRVNGSFSGTTGDTPVSQLLRGAASLTSGLAVNNVVASGTGINVAPLVREWWDAPQSATPTYNLQLKSVAGNFYVYPAATSGAGVTQSATIFWEEVMA